MFLFRHHHAAAAVLLLLSWTPPCRAAAAATPRRTSPALAAGLTPSALPEAPRPGLDDVCAHLAPAERCSPEICALPAAPGGGAAVHRLAARTYYQDRPVLLPAGARVVGAGINKTFVVACGAPSSGRRGFILNNNTYLGHLTWQGLQGSRGGFDAAVGTPGCLSTSCQGGCIPADGDCAGIANATVEHIHNAVYAGAGNGNGNGTGRQTWPLSTSVGWFPETLPWGPDGATGSRNITVRGLTSWGTWADGINFHGGHRDVLIEGCELSYTGDDPIGLWPGPAQCQRNIVVRNNTARWPRQYAASRAGGPSPRDYPACDCSDAGPGQCYAHTCFATYAGGSGVQFVHNHCEGARNVLAFNGAYPDPSRTRWCGVLTVAGNTYAEMPGQGSGCRSAGSAAPPCLNRPDPPGTVGGQCAAGEPTLPPPCDAGDARFARCRATPGVGGICYNNHRRHGITVPTTAGGDGVVECVTAERWAAAAAAAAAGGGGVACAGFHHGCTIYE